MITMKIVFRFIGIMTAMIITMKKIIFRFIGILSLDGVLCPRQFHRTNNCWPPLWSGHYHCSFLFESITFEHKCWGIFKTFDNSILLGIHDSPWLMLIFSCPGSSIPTLGDSLGNCHFRICPQNLPPPNLIWVSELFSHPVPAKVKKRKLSICTRDIFWHLFTPAQYSSAHKNLWLSLLKWLILFLPTGRTCMNALTLFTAMMRDTASRGGQV